MAYKMGPSIASLVLMSVLATGLSETGPGSNVELESPAIRYWHRVLPATPIPDTLRELISPLSNQQTAELVRYVNEEKVAVNVGKGGVTVGTGKAGVNVGKGGVAVGTKGGKGKGKGQGTHVNVGTKSPYNYNYAADEQMIADPSASLFFLETDLQEGAKLTLHFRKAEPGAPFLPRRLADAVPFSSDKLSVAFHVLNVSPGSDAAVAMRKTVGECETPAIEGESKFCATSLESMVDYATSKLGTRVTVLETKVPKESGKQDYTITAIPFRGKSGTKSVACHSENYAYAVYYCHETEKSRAFQVSLKGTQDGSTAQGVAVCHEDTSGWNPEHIAFKVLNVKPGGAAVCHFIPEDHIVWLPSN